MEINNNLVVSSPTDIQRVIVEQGQKQEKVAIVYGNSSDGNTDWRPTEPYSIKNGKYYGYDTDKNDHIRAFSLEEIISACPIPEGFVARWEVSF